MQSNPGRKRDLVAVEDTRDRPRDTVIKQDLHQPRHLCEALADEVRNGSRFHSRHVENSRYLLDGHAARKVFEHQLNRHPRSPKDPCATDLSGNALQGGMYQLRNRHYHDPRSSVWILRCHPDAPQGRARPDKNPPVSDGRRRITLLVEFVDRENLLLAARFEHRHRSA